MSHDDAAAQEAAEEEAYYARLCAAAPGDNDEEEELKAAASSERGGKGRDGGESKGEPSELEYFGAIHDAATSSEVVLPEDSFIWQSLLRSAASSGPNSTSRSDSALHEVESSSQRELLSQWLFSHLPSSSDTFCRLRTLMLRSASKDKDVTRCYADHVQHPSLVLLITLRKDSSNITAHIFSSLPLSPSLATQVARLSTLLPCPKVIFAAIDVWMFHDALLPPLLDLGLRQTWVEPVSQWVLADAWPLNASGRFPLPAGYFARPLTTADANLVDATWKYKSEGSLDAVCSIISSLPCVGICDETSLVCWCLVDIYGALGKLFTVREHRGKGLARCVVARLIDAFLQDGFKCSPFCYITTGNDASSSVFKSLGFTKRRDCEWLGVQE